MLDVSQFDRVRLCQWLTQLLKYIDKLQAELSDETADAEAYFETTKRLKQEIENLQDTHDEMRIQDERASYETWNDDGGQ